MHFLITSTQNPKIKSLLALEKPRERRKQQLFIVEGVKEIKLALESGYKIGNIFFCEEIIDPEESQFIRQQDKLLIPVSKEVFDKIAIPFARFFDCSMLRFKVHMNYTKSRCISFRPFEVI